jgi:DNA glycosylase AlkZ-like
MARPAVLVDGVVGGHWRLETTRAAATLRVELFEPIGPADAALLADEGARAPAFAAPDAATSEVQLQPRRSRQARLE